MCLPVFFAGGTINPTEGGQPAAYFRGCMLQAHCSTVGGFLTLSETILKDCSPFRS